MKQFPKALIREAHASAWASVFPVTFTAMLLAYIDEVGETGAFVSRDHDRFKTSPVFGYAGFIVPSDHARELSGHIAGVKRDLFATEISEAKHSGRWERKGASIFRPDTLERYENQIRAINGIIWKLRRLKGHLFYYVDEKPIGTPKQTKVEPTDRESSAMREALNRIARHADKLDHNVMVMIDQINERERAVRLPKMYSHILGRATDYPEMRRIIEPPMHIDSQLSPNIQFADWIAACVTRAVDYQLIENSPYQWVATCKQLEGVRGAFTNESKVHLHHRAAADFNHSEIYRAHRPLYPEPVGQLIAVSNRAKLERVRLATVAAARRGH